MAPNLQNFSTELLLRIARQMRPDDMVSFSRSCKLFSQVLQDELQQHRERKTAIHTVATSDLLIFLNHSTADWRLPFYVKNVSVNWKWWEKTGWREFMKKYCAGLGHLRDITTSSLLSKLPTLVLLLRGFLNITRLELVDFETEQYVCLRGLLEAVQADETTTPNGTLERAFEHLETVCVCAEEWNPGANSVTIFEKIYGPWNKLLFSREFHVKNLHLHSTIILPNWTFTSLELTNCSFCNDDVVNVLQGCERLRSFAYHWSTEDDDIDDYNEGGSYQMLDALRSYCSRHLERLQISGRVTSLAQLYGQHTVPEFSFNKLKYIHLPLGYFIDIGEGDTDIYEWLRSVTCLGKFLPRSAEHVVISVDKPMWLHKADDLLRGLVVDAGIQDKFCSLISIRFESMKFTVEDIARLNSFWFTRCDDAGVNVAFVKATSS